jgi:hypothetical protein
MKKVLLSLSFLFVFSAANASTILGNANSQNALSPTPVLGGTWISVWNDEAFLSPEQAEKLQEQTNGVFAELTSRNEIPTQCLLGYKMDEERENRMLLSVQCNVENLSEREENRLMEFFKYIKLDSPFVDISGMGLVPKAPCINHVITYSSFADIEEVIAMVETEPDCASAVIIVKEKKKVDREKS